MSRHKRERNLPVPTTSKVFSRYAAETPAPSKITSSARARKVSGSGWVVQTLSSSKPIQGLTRATLRSQLAILCRGGLVETERFGDALRDTLSPFQRLCKKQLRPGILI
jgi:hypothetical protein